MHDNQLRIALIGDVVGEPGMMMAQRYLPLLRQELSLDAIVINGENSAQNGRGITPQTATALLDAGATVITTGNHIWGQKEIVPFMQQATTVLRPINFPVGTPGLGATVVQVGAYAIAVINAQGRVFMRELLDCPFRTVEAVLARLKQSTAIICVDFHAETTAETAAFAFYMDGKVSCVVGTHTHVQTADERVLPHGTAFITDLGMCGSLNSNLGMKKEGIIQNFLTQMPIRFEVDKQPPFVLSGVVVTVNPTTGKALDIKRIRIVDEQ